MLHSGHSSPICPGRQEAYIDTDRSCRRRVLVVLIHAVVVHRETQVADLGETNRLAGFLFELLVKIDRVLVYLTDAVAHIEERQKTGSVPGGAGCELAFLYQHDIVAPALLREVIERTDADHATTDNDNSCLIFH